MSGFKVKKFLANYRHYRDSLPPGHEEVFYR